MTEFVVGLVFTKDADNLLLIKKKRPAWQLNALNGIGGHIEEGESPLEAMTRECREEACLNIIAWENFCQLHGEECRDGKGLWRCYYYRVFTDALWHAKTNTDERLIITTPHSLPSNCVSNLYWQVPLALDRGIILPVIVEDGKG